MSTTFTDEHIVDADGCPIEDPGLPVRDYGTNGSANRNGDGNDAKLDAMPEIVSSTSLCDGFKDLMPVTVANFGRLTEIINIIASSKAFKTFTAIYLAICICIGRKFLNRFDVTQGRVLYIDCELHKNTFAYRLRKIASAMGLTLEDFGGQLDVLTLRGNLRDLMALDTFFRSIPKGKYSTLVIDALYRLVPKGYDENSNSDMTQIYNRLDQIAAMTGAMIVVVHHSTKGVQAAKSTTEMGSGAAGARACDNHIVMRPHKQENCVVMEMAPRSFPPVEPIGLRMHWPLWEIDESLDTDDLLETGRRTKKGNESDWNPSTFAGAFLTNIPKTKASIIAAATARKLKTSEVNTLLNAAVDDGYAHEWKGTDRKAKYRYALIPEPAKGAK